MPVQVKQGPLLQFADDICLVCCGDRVSKMLSDDLSSLSSWIAASRMQVNVRKSSVMWFRIRQYKARVSSPPVYLDGSSLSCVEHHKYLGIHFDSQLSWNIHVGHICKMSYYSSIAIPQNASRLSCIISTDLCSFCLGPFFKGKLVDSTTSFVQLSYQNYLWFTEV